VQQPRQRDLHRCGPEPARSFRESRRLQRRKPAEREEGHVCDALPGQVVDQGVVLALDHVVVVLHAHNVGDRLRLCYLGGRDVAQTDVADQPLAPEVSQHRHRLGDGPLLEAVARTHRAVVDDVESVQVQVTEVVVDAGSQLFGRDGQLPRFIGRPAGPELGDDHQPYRVGMQSLPNYLVSDVRAIEVRRVDMVHASRDGLAEDRHGIVRVLGRSPYAGSGQLHRTVTYPLHRQLRAGKRELAASWDSLIVLLLSSADRSKQTRYVAEVKYCNLLQLIM
jgi:hypothetical protein